MSFILRYVSSSGLTSEWRPLADKMAALKQARDLLKQKCTQVSLTCPDGSKVEGEALAALIATLSPDP